jgi:Tol biopolymer transport system component
MNQRRQPTLILTASAILLMATAPACGTAAKPDVNLLATPAASVSDEGTLIFQSSRDGNDEIYRVQADGTRLTNLTHDLGADTNAVWSPDGKQIAFISDRSGLWGLYVMNADGTREIQLTYNDLEETELAWSPDGTRIAFAASPVQTATPGPDQSASPTDLFIINVDGSAQIQLTVNDSGAGGLSWQPIVP